MFQELKVNGTPLYVHRCSFPFRTLKKNEVFYRRCFATPLQNFLLDFKFVNADFSCCL